VAGYADAQRVADAFRRDTPVMVDLQGCDADAARRVTDFCSGLAYARDGGLRAVADGLFLLSPTHVELSQDGRRGLADSGFYNQI
ncbi:MAG: cell division protein SepF, partial [Thermoleophilia bacterium]